MPRVTSSNPFIPCLILYTLKPLGKEAKDATRRLGHGSGLILLGQKTGGLGHRAEKSSRNSVVPSSVLTVSSSLLALDRKTHNVSSTNIRAGLSLSLNVRVDLLLQIGLDGHVGRQLLDYGHDVALCKLAHSHAGVEADFGADSLGLEVSDAKHSL